MISEINPEHIKLLGNCFKKWRHFYHEELRADEMWCRYVEYEHYYENYWSREAERWARLQSRREKDLTAAGEDEEGSDDIEVGAELLGRWFGDGEFYDCVVEEVTETGYIVLFTEYGNREELTIDDLRWYDDDEERWWAAGIIQNYWKKIR